jgi:hypothetical protein
VMGVEQVATAVQGDEKYKIKFSGVF